MFLRRLRAFFADRRGNVGIIFGLTAVPAIGVVGAGLDFARANQERAAIQMMLDSAVLAGIAATKGTEIATAQAFFDAQSSGLDLADTNASFSLTDSTLTGTASGTLDTTLLGVMNISSIEVAASAAARRYEDASAGAGSGSAGKVCILLLDASASQSLLANSGAKVTAPGCEIHVRSTANPAAIFNSGSDFGVQKICVKGTKVIINGSAKPPVETGCAAIDDPYAGKLPSVSVPTNCTVSNANYNANGSDVTLAPGNHCGANLNSPRNVYMSPGLFQNINFNGSPTITMAPGLYIFKNTSVINSGATVIGTGVTIYFADANSKIQFNGNVTLKLSAPASGNFAGILFMEPPNLSKTQLVFNNTSNTTVDGLFYLPSRNVTINSVSNITGDKVMMIFNTLILNSTGWTFTGAEKAVSTTGAMTTTATVAPRIVLTK